MGLLDDAIREHLELKRRHGEDPEATARQARDLLGSTDMDEDPARDEQLAVLNDAVPQTGQSADPPGPAYDEDLAHTGEETAELDMQTVLDGEQGAQRRGASSETGNPSASPDAAAGNARPPATEAESQNDPGQDSLEWEMPGKDKTAGGQNGESDDEATGTSEEPVEDVLEETPDFLRDTPDQDRLWFEQQPPRDFDFDK
jgi:hypothetical protein